MLFQRQWPLCKVSKICRHRFCSHATRLRHGKWVVGWVGVMGSGLGHVMVVVGGRAVVVVVDEVVVGCWGSESPTAALPRLPLKDPPPPFLGASSD